jgi:hypothetical protein
MREDSGNGERGSRAEAQSRGEERQRGVRRKMFEERDV